MARGYILLEAMIGGALVSTVLLALFGQVGEAQAESTRQARLITAEQLVLREVEELRSLPMGAASLVQSKTTTITMPSNGTYLVERVVSADITEQVRTSDPVAVVYREITIKATFPDRTGRRGASTITRMYRE